MWAFQMLVSPCPLCINVPIWNTSSVSQRQQPPKEPQEDSGLALNQLIQFVCSVETWVTANSDILYLKDILCSQSIPINIISLISYMSRYDATHIQLRAQAENSRVTFPRPYNYS